MKGIQSLKDQKSSKTIKEDHMEEIFDEDWEDQKEIKIIGIDQLVVLERTLLNLINQQDMNKYPNHDYVDL
jgi:hypothetical protein